MRRVLIPHTACAVLSPPAEAAAVRRLSGQTMGTTWAVALVVSPDHDLAPLHAGIEQRLESIVAQMSTWRTDSDLSRFNQAPAGVWCDLPDDLLLVLDYAWSVAQESGGAYDPTVGPLVNLWGFGPDGARRERPTRAAIDAARARVGWRRVELDVAGRRARHEGGVYVDLSAVAKGFAVDDIAAFLVRAGVASCLVEIGGELCGMGTKPGGQPWWVGLERPAMAATGDVPPAEGLETVVALHELSVASSGDYRRYFDAPAESLETVGRRYSHTIDPRTGEPVSHRVASVSVLHRSCMVADALSTALFVLDVDEGLRMAQRRDLAALFVSRTPAGLEERMTPAFVAMLDA